MAAGGAAPGRRHGARGIYQELRRLIDLRKHAAAFNGHELDVLDTGSEHVFGCLRRWRDARVLALANFSVPAHEDFGLAPCQFAWLQS